MFFHRNVITRVIYSIPVILVLSLVIFLYYCYVISFLTQFQLQVVIVPFLIFQLTVFLLLWSYTMSVITDPGSIPTSLDLLSQELIDPSTLNSKDYQRAHISTCSKCNCKRPPRSHHCSHCDRCILKMDHHCPWIGNCVGYRNHRFFIQFLGYGSISCLNLCMSCLAYLKDSNVDKNILSLIGCVVGGFMFVALLVLFGFHMFLVVTNQTTLEVEPQKEFNVFDSGSGTVNCFQVFGDRFWPMVLPIRARLTVDGVVYPVKLRVSCGEPLLVKDRLLT